MASIISAGTTSGTSLNLSGDTSGVLQLASNGSTTALTIDTSQKVGIGTTSPGAKLQVTTGGANSPGSNLSGNIGQFTSSGGIAYVTMGNGDSANQHRYVGAASAIQVFGKVTDAGVATEQMRIDSSGNLLIGKTSASGTTQGIFLQGDGIYAFTKNESGTGPLGYFVNANGTVDNGYRFASFRVTAGFAEVGTITTNGTSTTAYNTSSDYRLKENVAPMTGALNLVQQLKPVTYKWKADGSDGQGFIAHELQAVVPDCVTGEKDAVDKDGNPKYQGVDTSFLVATLTAAIQELKAELDATKAEVQALKGAL